MQGSYSPNRLRWLGLACSVAMAASAYLAGAPAQHGPGWGVGVALWAVGAAGLVAVWWRLRTVAAPGWLLATGALWALPLLLAPPLGSHDVYAYACQGELVAAGLDPYVAGPDALPCRWLDWVSPTWRGTPAPYGALWLLVERFAAVVAAGSLPVAVTLLRLAAIGGVLLATVAGARLARRCGAEPARVVWLGALGPLTLVHAVSGAHNDALLAGLVVAGLLAAAGPLAVAGSFAATAPLAGTDRRTVVARLVLAGVAFGAAASIKATALVVVPFALAVVPWARTGRRRIGAGGVLAGATVGTIVLLAGLTGHGFGFVQSWPATAGNVQWSSIPTGVGMAVGYGLRMAGRPEAFANAVEVARLAGLCGLAVVLVVLWRRAVRGPVAEAVSAAGLALLATALLGPVFYAWYALAGVAVLAATAPRGRAATLLYAGAAALIFLTLPDSLGLVTKTKVPGALLDLLLVCWGLARWAGGVRRVNPHRSPTPGPARPSALAGARMLPGRPRFRRARRGHAEAFRPERSPG
ncbi:polyprenol phosphomannose-dependent alpha 1,6 mannosyltransferase MptB [Plantactinospora solaniradicis]|uniref:Polyprenol phosphomannose-dependent alpha 1,6 mannosyltransferase MptB n=1 Tax=Plantactinospora solaniradicis TaxID=1723736 RepID=A0ABW1K6T7_9ACTN